MLLKRSGRQISQRYLRRYELSLLDWGVFLPDGREIAWHNSCFLGGRSLSFGRPCDNGRGVP